MAPVALAVVAAFAFFAVVWALAILIGLSMFSVAMPMGLGASLVYERVRFGMIGGPARAVESPSEAQRRRSGLAVGWLVTLVAYGVVGFFAVVAFGAAEWVWPLVGLVCIAAFALVRRPQRSHSGG